MLVVLLVKSALVSALAATEFDASLASLRDDTLRSRSWLIKLLASLLVLALVLASGEISELVVRVDSEYK